MILYFSGTGNSLFVAKQIAQVIEDEVISINQYLKENKAGVFHSEKPYVFVCSIYSWRIPNVIEHFIQQVSFSRSQNANFVLTCGDGIANADYYTKRLCNEKGFHHLGTIGVVMPENYIAMFDVPDKKEANEIIEKALPNMKTIAHKIKNNEFIKYDAHERIKGLKSGIVNTLFYRFFVSAKDFYVTDVCIDCGICKEICPLNNIEMMNHKPKWNKNCTHCMACINICPKRTIEYKKKSLGQPRYYLKEYPMV